MASIEKIWKKICEKPYRSDITMQELEKVFLPVYVKLTYEIIMNNELNKF